MACTIMVNTLQDGQDIMLPWTVSGTVMSTMPGVNVTAVASQLDNGDINNFAITGLPSVTAGFSLELTNSVCTQTNVWYMLTIYAWDDTSQQATMVSLTFRISPPLMPGP